jgi:2-polyprenyl-6-methoxyphenol hydroxylase-like FAD-dependent oxidoreductase
MEYDVVIVGTRVAGAATAMLLARQGLRVLAVDRARFPSDTLSSHQVQVPGAALLHEWGLLDALTVAGTPATRTVTFDAGPAVLRGGYPSRDGVDALYSPRRTLLDSALVDAARNAGAEILEGFIVEDLLTGDGRVTGVRGTVKGGPTREFRARVVVGADGKHSMVARSVGATEYRTRPATAGACYAYFSDLPVSGGEVYARPDRMVGLWPTNDGLTIVFLAVPRGDFAALQSDMERQFRDRVSAVGDLGSRLAAARRMEHHRGTIDLPNTFRTPYGPGWVLVGDAGLVMDPITGQGIGNALQDAAAVSDAIVAGLGGARPLDAALDGFHRARDKARRPMYDLTVELASFRPDPTADILFPAIARDPAHVNAFLGVLAGVVPMTEFFSPGNLRRIVGARGLARMLWRRVARWGSARSLEPDGVRRPPRVGSHGSVPGQ